MKKIAYFLILIAIAAPCTLTVSIESLPIESLTTRENKVLALVNSSEAWAYDLHLENIALSHYAFRAAGSAGANETADWIAEQFENLGLETKKEEFQFTCWDLLSKPVLLIDDDGNNSTINDQTIINSFQCEHYSLAANIFADLVILPLPPAVDHTQLGFNPIGNLWDSIDTGGKVVLVGREVRLDYGWQATFNEKLRAQPPAAVIHTWWYDWMAFVPDFFSSAGGRPVAYNHYFWALGIPVGFVNYQDGLLIRNIESSLNVSANVVINSVAKVGPQYNVVGKLRGFEEPDKSMIICGHYDTIMSTGFCDNGAGTSAVIELAHVFTEAANKGVYYPKYSILFIALAGEEIGLVGSIYYVAQHKAEMQEIVAVLNLDCIGSDILEVTETSTNFAQIVVAAAGDLNVEARLIPRDQSDEAPFLYPPNGDNILTTWWDTSLGMGDAHQVDSSVMISSFPLLYRDQWDTGTPGWIHTSYDNSTSTRTLNWVEPQAFEAHIKVTALTIIRVLPPAVFDTDLNKDGTINIIDIATIAKAFGTKPVEPRWNAAADLDKNGIVDTTDLTIATMDFDRNI